MTSGEDQPQQPPPEAPTLDPGDAAAAQRDEAAWLMAQQVTMLQQRCVQLHANLLMAQRRVAELEAVAVEPADQEREPGT